jgi:hypothetical protein
MLGKCGTTALMSNPCMLDFLRVKNVVNQVNYRFEVHVQLMSPCFYLSRSGLGTFFFLA